MENTIFRKTLTILITLFSLALWLPFAHSQITPTNEWVNFYSRYAQLDGLPVPVGTVIDAFDPDSVHCGTFTVTTAGEYGFLVVYRDDALTIGMDEGCVPGDTVTFFINGIEAKTLGPADNIWMTNGDVLEVDLATNLVPSIAYTIPDIFMNEDDPDLVVADLDTVFTNPDGDFTQYFTQSSQQSVIDSIDSNNRFIISLAADWSGEAEIVLTVFDGWAMVRDTLQLFVSPVNDAPVISTIPDISFRNDTTITLDLNDYVEDIDHDITTLTWEADVDDRVGDSLVVQIDNGLNIALFEAAYNYAGESEIVFTARDGDGASDNDTINVRVDFPTGVHDPTAAGIPRKIVLMPNYPNPFNPETTIQFGLPEDCEVELFVSDMLGRYICKLESMRYRAGWHYIVWDGRDESGTPVSSGLYFIQFKAGNFQSIHKMTLTR